MTIMAMLELASIGLILPVIQVVLQDDSTNRYSTALINLLPRSAESQAASWISSIFAVFFLLKNLLLLGLYYWLNRVMFDEGAHLTAKMYHIYLLRPVPFFLSRNSSEIIRNLITGCAHSVEALRLVLMVLLDGLLMLAAIILLLLVEPAITMIAAAILGTVAVGFYIVAAPRFRAWGQGGLTIEADLIKWINQSIGNIRDVKILNVNHFMDQKISNLAFYRAGFLARSGTAINIPRLSIETVIVIGYLAVAFYLTAQRQSTAEIIGVLGVFGMASLRLMPSLNRLIGSATEIKLRTSYIDALFADSQHHQEAAFETEKTDLPFEQNIRFDRVSFAYPDSDVQAVKEIDLSIKKGQSVGIVGPSGAGKSTLIDIVLGFLAPQHGSLRIDERDAFSDIGAWQRRIGFVPQEIQLLDDTLRRNIAFGIDDEAIVSDRIETVLELSQLSTFVAELPKGVDTVVAERGARLSGGQRQRVAIARALYRNPDILVFDEATSALDSETEREVVESIDALAGHKTILIIAHRMSTVRHCDKVVIMNEGRVSASGRFDDLMRDNAQFRQMAGLGNIEAELANQP